MAAPASAQLGKTSIRVPSLAVGTTWLGGFGGSPPLPVDEAHAILRRALELGIHMFDTAPQYGGGIAETRVGELARSAGREQVLISTKVGRLIVPMSFGSKVGRVLRHAVASPGRGPRLVVDHARRVVRELRQRSGEVRLGYPFGTGEQGLGLRPDYTYDGAMRSFEDSIRRLGTDRIDVLHIHDPDDVYEEAKAGAYRALRELRETNAVGAIGVGMNDARPLARFAREGDFDCFLVAGRYTLLDQTALDDLLPVCAERSISVFAAGVYNSGLLANPRPGATFDYRPANASQVERAQAIEASCRRHGVSIKAAALQFPLAHPAVTTVVLGVRTVEELEENVALSQVAIPEELWVELREARFLRADAPTPTSSRV